MFLSQIDLPCIHRRINNGISDSEISKKFKFITENTINILKSEPPVLTKINSLVPHLFDFRVNLIQEALNKRTEVDPKLEDCYDYFESLNTHNDPHYIVLIENILFAIKCEQKVLRNIPKSFSFQNIPVNTVNNINYEQFIVSIMFGLPTDLAQKMLNIARYSFLIDFVCLSVFLINEEKINVSIPVIDEIASIAADSAQEYMSIGYQIGLLKRNNRNRLMTEIASKDFDEQKLLAETGLKEFREYIDN